jgi:hypothetical protein
MMEWDEDPDDAKSVALLAVLGAAIVVALVVLAWIDYFVGGG